MPHRLDAICRVPVICRGQSHTGSNLHLKRGYGVRSRGGSSWVGACILACRPSIETSGAQAELAWSTAIAIGARLCALKQLPQPRKGPLLQRCKDSKGSQCLPMRARISFTLYFSAVAMKRSRSTKAASLNAVQQRSSAQCSCSCTAALVLLCAEQPIPPVPLMAWRL